MFGLQRRDGKHIVTERGVREVEFELLHDALEYVFTMLYIRGKVKRI